MGFSIWVADDPELLDETARSSRPHFSCSMQAMSFLRDEMLAQKMVSRATIVRKARTMPIGVFLFNDGWRLTSAQVTASLQKAKRSPISAGDPEAKTLWRDWLGFLKKSLTHGGIVVY